MQIRRRGQTGARLLHGRRSASIPRANKKTSPISKRAQRLHVGTFVWHRPFRAAPPAGTARSAPTGPGSARGPPPGLMEPPWGAAYFKANDGGCRPLGRHLRYRGRLRASKGSEAGVPRHRAATAPPASWRAGGGGLEGLRSRPVYSRANELVPRPDGAAPLMRDSRANLSGAHPGLKGGLSNCARVAGGGEGRATARGWAQQSFRTRGGGQPGR